MTNKAKTNWTSHLSLKIELYTLILEHIPQKLMKKIKDKLITYLEYKLIIL